MKNVKKKEEEVLLLNSYKNVVFSEKVKKLIEKDYMYEFVRWMQTPFGKRKRITEVSYIGKLRSKPLHYLDMGFLPRIEEKLKKEKIPYSFNISEYNKFSAEFVPLSGGITLRGNQPEIVEKALSVNRGIIHAYTSFGKTITAAALINSYLTKYPKSRAIFLAHTVDLIQQTAEEFRKVLPFDVGVWQGKTRENARVVCATRQTIAKIDPKEYENKFLVVIRDECHRSGDEYFKILYNLNCPVRYGITATLPNKRLEALRLEGSVGPVIGTVTIAEGAAMGLLAIPEITLLTYVNKVESVSKSYHGVYRDSITDNKERNEAIRDLAVNLESKGESSLIFVREIEHGRELNKIIPNSYLVNGSSSKTDRMKIKQKLEKKDVKIVICSTIWNEGISIKSLNNCIIAGAGSDDKMVMQIIGRGTRIDEGKDTVKIWDFLDTHKYMSSQTIKRMEVYAKSEWKINIVHHENLLKFLGEKTRELQIGSS